MFLLRESASVEIPNLTFFQHDGYPFCETSYTNSFIYIPTLKLYKKENTGGGGEAKKLKNVFLC